MHSFDSLLTFLGRDQRTATDLWVELCELRRINGPEHYRKLPAEKSELLRQLRAAKAAGLLVEEWPKGAIEAEWRPGRRAAERQAELFG